jgi:hypothetical protein
MLSSWAAARTHDLVVVWLGINVRIRFRGMPELADKPFWFSQSEARWRIPASTWRACSSGGSAEQCSAHLRSALLHFDDSHEPRAAHAR